MLLSVGFMLRWPVRSAVVTLIVTLGAFASAPMPTASAPPPARVNAAIPSTEVRALWVVRTTLTSPAAIATLAASAKAGGFNTLLVQVRGRGDAYFQGGSEPRPAALVSQPSFDPLAEAIARGHEAGLQVHAWLNVNLVAGLDLPAAREHVIYRHPEWLMVPRAIAPDLASVDVHSPEYLGRLSRYARSRATEVEGLYLSPVSDAAASYTTAVVRDIAARYAIDGVHFDYMRYPDEDFDYGRDSVAEYQRQVPEKLRTPDRWRSFRAERLTALVVRLRQAVKDVRPAALVSAAVAPDPVEALTHRLQDWRDWLTRDLLDVICPMAYAVDPVTFAAQVAATRQASGARPIWAGIGAYRLSPAQVVDNIQTARRIGVAGVILFSYDSLTDPSRGPDYLARLGRAAFTQ
jgi:uncharacterized lipoprotein YddW (UPF0748 family)